MIRRIITIIVVIAVVLGIGVFMARDHIWPPATTACMSQAQFAASTSLPSPTPTALTAQHLWGNAALSGMPARLPDGRVFGYLYGLSDGTILVAESYQCTNSWVSNYDPATDTIHHICSIPYGDVSTDGRYLAWVTGLGDGIDTLQQDVGYLDLYTCKQTHMFHFDAPQMNSPIVNNGYFFWSRGTIHMTNMATGQTKNLSLPASSTLQVVWPYLLYSQWDGVNSFIYYLHDLETGRDTKLAAPAKIVIPDSSIQPLDWYPTLKTGPIVYWNNDTIHIWRTSNADQSGVQPEIVFTIPDPDAKSTYVTDRLFIWVNRDKLYAWDRLLNQEVLLPDGDYIGAIPPTANTPMIYGNVLVLSDTPSSYAIIDTSQLPITVAP